MGAGERPLRRSVAAALCCLPNVAHLLPLTISGKGDLLGNLTLTILGKGDRAEQLTNADGGSLDRTTAWPEFCPGGATACCPWPPGVRGFGPGLLYRPRPLRP